VRSSLLSLERLSTALALTGACAMMVLAAALGMMQIVTRFILETPVEWSEVLIRFSLIWMVFLGIPAAFRQGAMVSVDVLHRLSPPRVRRWLDTLVMIITLVLLLVIIFWGWNYAQRGRVQSVIGLEGVSMFWAYLAMPVGALFCIPALIGQWLDPRDTELEAAQ
jgi:TRAP-type C4-dicarboxylate transport system permease small subunit